MKNEKWTQEEIIFISDNYPKFGNKFCAQKLDRTTRAIEERRKILKLKMPNECKNQTRIKYTKEMLIDAVKNSLCYSDVIRYFNLIPQAGNFQNFKKRIEQYKINTNHFLSSAELTKLRIEKKGRDNYFGSKQLKEILVKDSKYDSSKLKHRLFNEGLKEKKCETCGQEEDWLNKKLTFILDHKNGVHTDNRLENLRILCPNCNSVLDTHCSKNRRKK